MRRLIIVVVTATAAMVLVGCVSSAEVQDLNKRILSEKRIVRKEPNRTYVLDPPDSFQIESTAHPELSRTVVIRQDGHVTLPLLGDVHVQGLTTTGVKEKLENLYEQYYKDNDLLITVIGFSSKKVFVYGEVGRVGSLPYTGEQSVMDVLGAVGGVTQRAAPRRAIVLRSSGEEVERFEVDIVRLIVYGDIKQNVYLAEDDVLYVPPNVFAWIGYQIDNILFPFRSILSGAATYDVARDIGTGSD